MESDLVLAIRRKTKKAKSLLEDHFVVSRYKVTEYKEMSLNDFLRKAQVLKFASG